MLRCVALLVLFYSASVISEPQWFAETQHMMGTRITVEVYVEPAYGRLAIEKAMAEVRRIDLLMNPWDEYSELSALNESAAQSPFKTSPELYQLIKKAISYSKISEGAFDITFASLARFYRYKEAKKPSKAQFEQYKDAINYQSLHLNDAASTVYFSDERLSIDLGGIAKGYAVDQAIHLLKEYGVKSALVSAGGDTRVLGDRRGVPWVIGIKHPRNEQQHAVRLPLQNEAISTSGDYERFFIEDGKRYHHIIDPASAISASGVQSASILAPKAVDTDALSTTVFVLGVEKGLALVNRLAGVETVIIDNRGLLHYSKGLLRAK